MDLVREDIEMPINDLNEAWASLVKHDLNEDWASLMSCHHR
jgi:hypothetical protein